MKPPLRWLKRIIIKSSRIPIYPKDGYTRYGTPTREGIVREEETILQMWFQGAWVDVPTTEQIIDTTKQEETNIAPVTPLPVSNILDEPELKTVDKAIKQSVK